MQYTRQYSNMDINIQRFKALSARKRCVKRVFFFINSHFEFEYKKCQPTKNSSLGLELLINGIQVSFENKRMQYHTSKFTLVCSLCSRCYERTKIKSFNLLSVI